ncbi:hypothetical protein V6Z77_010216 [Aspergillus fumigatus]
MPVSVEADGHVRVAASVPVDGARLSGADSGARAGQLVTSGASRVRLGVSRPGAGPWRAPANWSPPVPASVSLGQRLSMARALACRRPACPRGSRQLVTPPPARAAPPAAPTRPANWPPRARLRAPPPSLPPSSPSSPSSPSLRRPRARDSLLASRARAYWAPSPLNRLPSTGTLARAAGGPSPTPYPPTSPGPSRARKRSRVRTSFRGEAHPAPADRARPCGHVPQPTGHCPSSPGGGGARVPSGHLGRPTGERSMEVEIPRTGRHRCPPRLRRKVSGPPPSARRCRAR